MGAKPSAIPQRGEQHLKNWRKLAMVMEFDTDVNTDFSEPPPAGKYHVSCIGFIEENDKGHMELEFEVLAGTVPHQEGRTKKMIWFNSTKMARWFHRLAIQAGLITQKELDELKAKGEFAKYDFELLKGRQFMVEITDEEGDDGTKYERIQPWHIWSPDDPKCAKWPKNEKFLKKAGYDVAKPAAKSETKKEEPDPDKLMEDF